MRRFARATSLRRFNSTSSTCCAVISVLDPCCGSAHKSVHRSLAAGRRRARSGTEKILNALPETSPSRDAAAPPGNDDVVALEPGLYFANVRTIHDRGAVNPDEDPIG